MSNSTSRGIIGERAAVLLEQHQHGKKQEADAKRLKPTRAPPKSVSETQKKGSASTSSTKPDRGFQIQADREQPAQVGLEGEELTGRRKDARVLDMQWKLDTYFVPKGTWVYMSKSYKEEEEERSDWCAFDEENQNATF
ncbi:hypothetical protein Hte_000393 [Hypoxylon texense]